MGLCIPSFIFIYSTVLPFLISMLHSIDLLIFFKYISKVALLFGKQNCNINFAAQSTFILNSMNQALEDIKAIREMMEKSSKFISLSGLSGIMSGIIATAGAAFAYFYLLRDSSQTTYSQMQETLILLVAALIVLFLSMAFAIYFSWRKARKNQQTLFNKLTMRILYSMAIPLFSGGIFCLVLLFKGEIGLVMAGTLIFYGLALINASKYTFNEVHYLGIVEIILGIAAAIFVREGLLFWSIGFGICHIIYGIVMYIKYDLKKE